MTDEWPTRAVDYVQAITDTKLVLSHRYSTRMFSSRTMEDRSADATAAQEELGHARQLFNLLEDQGREVAWLQGDRDANEYYNAASLDQDGDTWLESLVRTGVTDRAAWLLLDAIDHPDFEGMVQKIGEEEYFHLEHQDGRLLESAANDPGSIQDILSKVFQDVLAFIGPADYTAENDSLYSTGFTTTPAATLRERFHRHYAELFRDTEVSLEDVDLELPAANKWNEARRRVGDGSVDEPTAESLQWSRKELQFEGQVSDS